MTKPLDPKFAKVVGLMRSTTHEGERASARTRAAAIAQRCGMTLDEALRQHDAPTPTAVPRNFMDGFDDWMEAREPGYRAREAEKRCAKVAAWRIRKAAILARYGSEEAALAPCWRERLILDAVAPWREVDPDADFMPGRWTHRLDGWSGYGFERDKMPAHVREAIATAYPLPSTFAEARAEHDYWEARDDEMGDVLDERGTDIGDTVLDIAAGVRACMVRDLAENDLPITTLVELHGRFAMYLDNESHDTKTVKGIFDSLTAMMEREASPSPPAPAPSASIRPSMDGSIRDALATDPSRSDRSIARAFGCSPSTVGRIRGQMGLAGATRSVRRGGQMYGMRTGARQERQGR